MEVPPWKLLEQTAIAVRISTEGESILIPILQRNEIAVLQTTRRILSAIGIKLEILQRRRRRFIETKQVDDKSNVSPIVGNQRRSSNVLIEPIEMRRSRGITITGEIQPKMREKKKRKKRGKM